MTTPKLTADLLIPPSANWYCTHVLDVHTSGILAYGARNFVIVMNINTQSLLNFLDSHSGRVSGVSFFDKNAPLDSPHLVSGSSDKQVILWDLETSKPIRTHSEHSNDITAISSCKHYPHITLSGDEAGMIVAWFPLNGKTLNYKPIAFPITTISFSPRDPKLAVVGYNNGMILALDCISGNVVQKICGHTAEIHSLVWSPSYRTVEFSETTKEQNTNELNNIVEKLVSSSKDGLIIIWSVENKNNTCFLQLSKIQISHQPKTRIRIPLECSFDNTINKNFNAFQKIYFGGIKGEILELDLKTFVSKKVSAGHARSIFVLKSVDSQRLLSVSMDRNMILWDTRNFKKLWEISTIGSSVYCLDESPVNKGLFAIGLGDNVIRIWNSASTVSYLQTLYETQKTQSFIANVKQSSSQCSSMYKYNSMLSTTSLWKEIQEKVVSTRWHPEQSKYLAYGTEGGHVGLINFENHKNYTFKKFSKKPIVELHFASPILIDNKSEKYNLYVVNDGHLICYSIEELLDGSSKAVNVDEFIYSNTTLGVPIFEYFSKKTGKLYDFFSKRTSFAFNVDYSLITIGSDDGTLELYKFPSFQIVDCWRDHLKPINRIKWVSILNSVGETLEMFATASEDETIRLYTLETCDDVVNVRRKLLLKAHTKSVVDLAWLPTKDDCKILISVSADQVAYMWNANNGSLLRSLKAHKGRIWCCEFLSLNPLLLLTGGDDQTLRISHIYRSLDKVSSNFLEKKSNLAHPTVHTKKISYSISQKSSLFRDPLNWYTKKSESHDKDFFNFKIDSNNVNLIKSENYFNDEYCRIYFNNDDDDDFTEHQTDNVQNFSDDQFKNDNAAPNWNPFLKLPQLSTLNASELMATNLASQFENPTDFQLLASFMAGNTQETLLNVIHLGLLNDQWVSLSIRGGYDLWLKVCISYAKQLQSNGELHRAVMYFLSAREYMSAIDVYENAHWYADAIFLASHVLSTSHKKVFDLYESWANHLVHKKHHVQAAKCYWAIGSYHKSIRQFLLDKSCKSLFMTYKLLNFIQDQFPANGSVSDLNELCLEWALCILLMLDIWSDVTKQVGKLLDLCRSSYEQEWNSILLIFVDFKLHTSSQTLNCSNLNECNSVWINDLLSAINSQETVNSLDSLLNTEHQLPALLENQKLVLQSNLLLMVSVKLNWNKDIENSLMLLLRLMEDVKNHSMAMSLIDYCISPDFEEYCFQYINTANSCHTEEFSFCYKNINLDKELLETWAYLIVIFKNRVSNSEQVAQWIYNKLVANTPQGVQLSLEKNYKKRLSHVNESCETLNNSKKSKKFIPFNNKIENSLSSVENNVNCNQEKLVKTSSEVLSTNQEKVVTENCFSLSEKQDGTVSLTHHDTTILNNLSLLKYLIYIPWKLFGSYFLQNHLSNTSRHVVLLRELLECN